MYVGRRIFPAVLFSPLISLVRSLSPSAPSLALWSPFGSGRATGAHLDDGDGEVFEDENPGAEVKNGLTLVRLFDLCAATLMWPCIRAGA